MSELIKVTRVPQELLDWLQTQLDKGSLIKVKINRRYVMSVEVTEPDNGDWSAIEFGNITSSNGLWFKQNVYRPAMVNNNFVFNYNGKRKEG